MKLAITGGTGFVGSHLIDAALAGGHEVQALARREQPPRDGVHWIGGSLDDRDALEGLVADADAIVHVAGVISARGAAAFEHGNVAGTLAMLAAATAGGIQRFIHVSSLAAREPKLSLYGASTAKAEELVRSSGLDWAIARAPAVYGPGDKEIFDSLRMVCDALIVAAGTIRAERYDALRLTPEARAWRRAHGLPEFPLMVIVSGSLDLDPELLPAQFGHDASVTRPPSRALTHDG